ncbi:hypothetical protein KSP40_PGU002083 [Platanthera guangdongensis]|uniref:Uncharacterized protein n=1 Tax=Platanthera guangdongensis TaxID=2320717 RepID=A0ABR2MYZ7_9ASPA
MAARVPHSVFLYLLKLVTNHSLHRTILGIKTGDYLSPVWIIRGMVSIMFNCLFPFIIVLPESPYYKKRAGTSAESISAPICDNICNWIRHRSFTLSCQGASEAPGTPGAARRAAVPQHG